MFLPCCFLKGASAEPTGWEAGGCSGASAHPDSSGGNVDGCLCTNKEEAEPGPGRVRRALGFEGRSP